MNRLLGSGLMLIGFCISVVPSFAQIPPKPKPLAERVDLATHVFVGRATTVRACELVDGSLRELVPEPAHTGPGITLELEVNVEEPLFPVTDNSPKTVEILFAPGFVSIKDARKALVGQQFIYLTRINSLGGQPFFFPSYPWHLVEKLSAREQIVAALEKRLAK